MQHGDHQRPASVFQAVQRAVLAVDPDGDQGTEDFLLRFEDRDEPITGMQATIEQEVNEAVGALDPDGIDPALQMCGAVTTYLAFRSEEITDDREHILRLAARAEFDGSPPAHVAAWLESEGVAL
jgi:hypothetical protein